MRCEQLMKRDARTVGVFATVVQAAVIMRGVEVGFLPICDVDRRVVGALTDRDIVVRAVAEGFPSDTPVGSIMTGEIVACRPDDDLQIAEERMMQAHVSRIVVVDDDHRLRGVLSLSDIAQVDGHRAADVLRAVASREARPRVDDDAAPSDAEPDFGAEAFPLYPMGK